jgi:hypothetical protein
VPHLILHGRVPPAEPDRIERVAQGVRPERA